MVLLWPEQFKQQQKGRIQWIVNTETPFVLRRVGFFRFGENQFNGIEDYYQYALFDEYFNLIANFKYIKFSLFLKRSKSRSDRPVSTFSFGLI